MDNRNVLHVKKVNRYKNKRLIYGLGSLAGIMTMYLVYFYIEAQDYINNESLVVWLGWACLIALISSLKYWKLATGSYISPINMFLVIFMVFCVGQVVLFSLQIREYNSYNIFYYFSYKEISLGATYTLICYLSFFLGGIIISENEKKKSRIIYDQDVMVRAINNVGIILFWLFLIPFLLHQSITISTGIKVGYKAINDYSNYSSTLMIKILVIFTEYFKCSILLLLIGSQKNKRRYDRILMAFLLYPIYLLLLGERTEPTSMILLLFWLRAYFFGKGGAKQWFWLAVSSSILILIYPAIMATRNIGMVSIKSILESILTEGVLGTIIDSIAGLGYSMFPLMQVMRLVPEYEAFRYGTSYLAALTNVVPYLGIAKKYSALSGWLMAALGMSYGPGFSMPAEAYLNFGLFPVPIMMIAGYLISKTLVILKSDSNTNIKLVAMGIFILTNISLPRRDFSGAVRDIVYYIFLISFLIKLYYYKFSSGKVI